MRGLAKIAAVSVLFIASGAFGQMRGVPASVTSIGAARGTFFPGTPASVTSINNFPRCCRTAFFPANPGFRTGFGVNHHFRSRFVSSGFGGFGFQPEDLVNAE